ncbi:MAG TPA: SDR family oxidoreductase [Streptosporangiaceae bacterium]|nr:SDR family oxidoreductase [Streptosporangiaceae bacterium]
MPLARHATAKAGMLGPTRAAAVDTARHGITVNALAPGWIATGSQAAVPTRRSGTRDGSATAGSASGIRLGVSRPRSRRRPVPAGPTRRSGTRCRCGAGSRTPGGARPPAWHRRWRLLPAPV